MHNIEEAMAFFQQVEQFTPPVSWYVSLYRLVDGVEPVLCSSIQVPDEHAAQCLLDDVQMASERIAGFSSERFAKCHVGTGKAFKAAVKDSRTDKIVDALDAFTHFETWERLNDQWTVVIENQRGGAELV